MARPVASNAQIVKQLTTSWEYEAGVTKTWDGLTVSFTINGPPSQNDPDVRGRAAMSSSEVGMARLAFQQWNELSNLHLVEASSGGQISFNYSNSVPSYALGDTYDATVFNPLDNGQQALSSATIHISASDPDAASAAVTVGSYGFMAYEHEIGHSLGLSHPGLYNADDASGPTYANDAEYSRDTRQYSIMSYFAEGADGSGANYQGYSPETPMIDDIMAIQAKYGANMTTRTENTVYGFNSSVTGTDAAIYDFSQNAHPVFTIWDAGGNDTINASGFGANQLIDLNAGHYSDVGGLKGNIGIAYNVTIENAVGGSGADTLIGNEASNNLLGGAGADSLNGGSGFDVLQGGTGNDVYYLYDASLRGATTFDSVVEAAGAGYDTVYVRAATGLNASGGQTTLTSYTLSANVEAGTVTGTAAFDLSGNGLNNALSGNGAANTLSGGDGNDVLNGQGGFDTLIGGGGDDIYVLGDVTMQPVLSSIGALSRPLVATYDKVEESAGGGTDTVRVGAASVTDALGVARTTASYTLGANIENGQVSGGAAFNLTGNDLNNQLFGNAAANVLDGGFGDDVLTGGLGTDTFNYKIAGFGADVITDFAVGSGLGHDVLAINPLFAADFSAAMSDFAQVGADAVMTLGVNGSLTLQNTLVSGLTASNFQFA